MPASIRDVARKAGVSPATVSKALNGTGSVSEERIRAIKQVARELNYQPNARARSFARKETKQIVFLADFPYDAAFVNPHLFEIMRGVQHALDKRGYSLVMKQADKKTALAFTEQSFAQKMADGIVYHASVMTKPLAALVARLGIAHIVIGHPNFENRLCWIDTDNCLSGELAAKHLIERGYTKIAFLSGRPDDMISWNRLRGARLMLEEHGLELENELVLQSNSTIPDGLRAAKKLLKMKERPQAVICANNLLAMGFMQGIQARGVHVPKDMALVSFDTYPFSLCLEPPLTVVDINMYDMGQEAGRLILQKIRHPGTQVQSYSTIPVLMQRGST